APSLVMGYVDQSLSNVPDRETPLEFIVSRYRIGDQRTRAVLADAGLPVEKQDKPIAQLSLGQKSRLALLGVRLSEPNFYLMDEPTNHVDIPGQEALALEIIEHGATCVLVSHDHQFLREVGTRFWINEKRRCVETDSSKPFFYRMARARNTQTQ